MSERGTQVTVRAVRGAVQVEANESAVILAGTA